MVSTTLSWHCWRKAENWTHVCTEGFQPNEDLFHNSMFFLQIKFEVSIPPICMAGKLSLLNSSWRAIRSTAEAQPAAWSSWGALTQALRAPGRNADTGARSPTHCHQCSGQVIPKTASTNNANLQAVAICQRSQQGLPSAAHPGEAEKFCQPLGSHDFPVPHAVLPFQDFPRPYIYIEHPSPTPCIPPWSLTVSRMTEVMAAAWSVQQPWGLGLDAKGHGVHTAHAGANWPSAGPTYQATKPHVPGGTPQSMSA